MRRPIRFLGLAIVMASMLALANPSARAGRVGGPLTTVATVDRGLSVYFEISFEAGDTAVVNIAGDGRSVLELFIYDSDGHAARGEGGWGDKKTATMDVYRSGVFRVEVRNLSVYPDTFTL